MAIDSKLIKLSAMYPDNKVVLDSVLLNGKHYRKKYNTCSELVNDQKNPRVHDNIELITINKSLFAQDPEFIMVYAHEERD